MVQKHFERQSLDTLAIKPSLSKVKREQQELQEERVSLLREESIHRQTLIKHQIISRVEHSPPRTSEVLQDRSNRPSMIRND
jgi:hypothetical protein